MINMKSKALQKLAVVLTLVIFGFVVLFAFPAEADKSRVEFEASLTVPASTYEYGVASIYAPPTPESNSYFASFAVPHGGTVKFYLFLSLGSLQLWQEGTYQPSWIEGDHGDFGISVGSQTGENEDLYLVVLNEASFTQDVKVWLTKTWHESNYIGLLTGSAIASLGVGIIPLLRFGKNRRQLAYSTTLFLMTYIMVAVIAWMWYRSYPPYSPFTYNLTETMPGILFFEAFPLIALLYLLHRNNGLAFFRKWKMGKRLQISGLLLVSGYMFPLAFMLFRMFSLFLYLPFNPDRLTTYSLIIGGLLMLTGLVIFVGLWATYHRRKSLAQFPT